MEIYVSSYQSSHDVVAHHQPAAIISFIDLGGEKPFFLCHASVKHLILEFDDKNSFSDETSQQQTACIAQLIEFLTQCDLRLSLLIHCMLGVSRSTAACFIGMNLYSKNREFEIAQFLRSKIPYALPNQAMIEIADKLLGRNGRMVQAIDNLSPPDRKEVGTYRYLSLDYIV
jgi:predicted protein tyrosine phosphatase